MASYNELTNEQRDVLQSWLNNLRAVSGELARVCNHMSALDTVYNSQVTTILAALTDNTVVPNTSGLQGAQALDVDAEAVTIMAHFQGVLTNYGTANHRQLWAKACGGSNLIG